MIWTVIFTNKVEKDLEKIPTMYVEKIILKLDEISKDNPYNHLDKLVNNSYYKLRMGPYRVIINIINDKMIILVLKIKHRSQSYKK